MALKIQYKEKQKPENIFNVSFNYINLIQLHVVSSKSQGIEQKILIIKSSLWLKWALTGEPLVETNCTMIFSC